jgi:hypothetical protein
MFNVPNQTEEDLDLKFQMAISLGQDFCIYSEWMMPNKEINKTGHTPNYRTSNMGKREMSVERDHLKM